MLRGHGRSGYVRRDRRATGREIDKRGPHALLGNEVPDIAELIALGIGGARAIDNPVRQDALPRCFGQDRLLIVHDGTSSDDGGRRTASWRQADARVADCRTSRYNQRHPSPWHRSGGSQPTGPRRIMMHRDPRSNRCRGANCSPPYPLGAVSRARCTGECAGSRQPGPVLPPAPQLNRVGPGASVNAGACAAIRRSHGEGRSNRRDADVADQRSDLLCGKSVARQETFGQQSNRWRLRLDHLLRPCIGVIQPSLHGALKVRPTGEERSKVIRSHIFQRQDTKMDEVIPAYQPPHIRASREFLSSRARIPVCVSIPAFASI